MFTKQFKNAHDPYAYGNESVYKITEKSEFNKKTLNSWLTLTEYGRNIVNNYYLIFKKF